VEHVTNIPAHLNGLLWWLKRGYAVFRISRWLSIYYVTYLSCSVICRSLILSPCKQWFLISLDRIVDVVSFDVLLHFVYCIIGVLP
jgi:hypothetical protein